MKDLLDKIEIAMTGRRHAKLGPLLSADFSKRPADMSPIPYQEEYRLDLRLGTHVICDRKELPQAIKNTKEVIINYLYGDVRGLLHKIRMAHYHRDESEMKGCIEDLQDYLYPQ